MNDKVKNAQQFVDGKDIAQAQIDFAIKFKGVYGDDLMVCPLMAVGPMQSFIGNAIELGILSVGPNAKYTKEKT